MQYIRWFDEIGNKDVGLFGGKNASLGEMFQHLKGKRIAVPDGFATTVEAYDRYLEYNQLVPLIAAQMEALGQGKLLLHEAGLAIRDLILTGEFPEDVATEVREAYREICRRNDNQHLDVAVRSSATAEDLPGASFAGQQESFLNIVGEHELIESCRRCFASLFTDRAISYREQMGFGRMKVGLSVGVQRMVHSDRSGAGVMFSIDMETGFPNVVAISASWGLGESVVQGAVIPDQYTVFKPLLADDRFKPIIDKVVGAKETKIVYAPNGSGTATVEATHAERQAFVLNDAEILQLARWAVAIEQHYGTPMDMEWAKDGGTGELFIVQAQPETVQSRRDGQSLKSYRLLEKGHRLVTGLSIGEAIAAGRACVIATADDIAGFVPGSILVAETTSPDWVPVMKRAAAIVTDHGGRTSHAAIVSRELGIPAIVGAGNATQVLTNGQELTVCCAEGEAGFVYEGRLRFEASDVGYENLPQTRTEILMNIADPAAAFHWWRLPARGIGLARMEFIITNSIKAHPMALLDYDTLADPEARSQLATLTAGYEDKTEFFVEHLAWGIARTPMISSSPVTVSTANM